MPLFLPLHLARLLVQPDQAREELNARINGAGIDDQRGVGQAVQGQPDGLGDGDLGTPGAVNPPCATGVSYAADVESAKAALVAAEYELEEAQDLNERFAIDRTDEQLQDAQEAYDEAAARYSRLLNGIDAEDLAASEAELAAAAARRA